MSRAKQHPNRQPLLFPTRADHAEPSASLETSAETRPPVASPPYVRPVHTGDIVISGSFRKDLAGLSREFEELRDLGFQILSPTNTTVVSESDGFVYMEGEQTASPEAIELQHLDAIRRARFVWLHTPDGYLGPSAALEVGFARASGIPVYARRPLTERALQALVTTVASPAELASSLEEHPIPPLPAVQSFQKYYALAAIRRGYEKETAQDTLLLMVEEFGELARALRKRQKLRRDGRSVVAQEEQELADIFIYVVHMANILGIDLATAVHSKEQLNIKRFLTR